MNEPYLGSTNRFDEDLSLKDLMSAVNTQRLTQQLLSIFPDGYAIKTLDEQTFLTLASQQPLQRHPIIFDFETIGYLEVTDAQQDRVTEALDWLQLLFGCSQRYIMASSMHVESVKADYEALNEEHRALIQSEQRFRALSEQLDKKVQEQLGTLEQTWRKLYTAEKQASVGQLAAGIAHEINNPIGFINSNLNTAEKYLGDLNELGEQLKTQTSLDAVLQFWKQKDLDFVFSDFTDLLNESKDGARRIADIVADLKVFTNLDSEEEITIDINRQLEVTCNMARTSIDEQIRLSFDHDQPCFIKCRPAYIGQLMLGLIMNGADALKQASTEDKYIKITSQQDAQQWMVKVEDNGKGIPADVLSRVFDPFFTTKQVGEGKGLGLTFCKDIIHGHDGRIDIQSTPDQGTVVSIVLPVPASKAPA